MADYTDFEEISFPDMRTYSLSGVAADSTPPFVASYSPSAGVIIPGQIITIEVEDDQDLDNSASGIQIYADYTDLDIREVIYDGSAFVGLYSGTVLQTTPPPGEVVTFTVQRSGGWYASPMDIIVHARDVEGNFVEDTESYTVDPDPTPPPEDVTLPVVGNFDPVAGSSIGVNDSISFDVTDNSGTFARIIVVAWFKETGVQEVIHDGDGFVGYYSAGSSRSIITNGYNYIITRFGGWEYAPTIRVFPIDSSGNEA